METNLGGPPHSIVKALSNPKGRNVAKAVGALLKWGNAARDLKLEQQSHQLLTGVMRKLETALPSTDPKLIGGFCADLLDLWETGQKLDKEIKKLTKLRLPEDREVLRDILHWINAIQLDMSSYWISEIKKDLPKLLTALDQLDRKSVYPRTKRRQRAVPKAQ